MRTRVAAVLAVLVWANPWGALAGPDDPAKSVEDVRQALANLQSQIDKLAGAVVEREKAKETAAASSLAEIAELRAEIGAIRQGMTEQRKAVDEAQADAQRLGEENKGLRAKLDQATKDRDEAAKARDQAVKERNETAKARDVASKATAETTKASVSSKAAEARAQEIEQLKAELAAGKQRIGELERQAAALAAAKVEAASSPSAPPVASAATAAVAEPAPAAPPAPDASTVVGGIKQWRQPDGKLFFGDNPPVAGSKLITVIGGGAPAPSAAEAKTAAP